MAMAEAGANFDIGRVIQRTIALVGRNFVPFFVLALVLTGLPALILQTVLPTDPAAIQNAPGSYATTFFIGLLVSLATGVVLQGALTRAAIDDLSGFQCFADGIVWANYHFFPAAESTDYFYIVNVLYA